MAFILIADDSPLFRTAYEKMLTAAGHRVITVEDGYACLLAAKEHQPDLILMDVVMPVMNGFQATRRLSRNQDTCHIPIVVSSTKNTKPDEVWALRQGATAYLVKPAKQDVLLNTVNSVLADKEASQKRCLAA